MIGWFISDDVTTRYGPFSTKEEAYAALRRGWIITHGDTPVDLPDAKVWQEDL